MEIGKCCKSGLFLPEGQLNISISPLAPLHCTLHPRRPAFLLAIEVAAGFRRLVLTGWGFRRVTWDSARVSPTFLCQRHLTDILAGFGGQPEGSSLSWELCTVACLLAHKQRLLLHGLLLLRKTKPETRFVNEPCPLPGGCLL